MDRNQASRDREKALAALRGSLTTARVELQRAEKLLLQFVEAESKAPPVRKPDSLHPWFPATRPRAG